MGHMPPNIQKLLKKANIEISEDKYGEIIVHKPAVTVLSHNDHKPHLSIKELTSFYHLILEELHNKKENNK